MSCPEHDLKNLFMKFSEENNMIAGVCDCLRLYAPDESELTNTPFVTGDMERRLNPTLLFPWAKSIIVIGVGYKKKCELPTGLDLRGRISQFAAGSDYHVRVAEKLNELAVLLRSRTELCYKIFVDTGDLIERSLAVSAGLGFVGKNRAVISEKFGSYFNIGYMLTDLKLKPDERVEKSCPEGCELCVSACPGKALTCGESTKPGGFDYRKCVSYLTQKKSDLTEEEMKSMGNRIYGCDVCQDICPINENVEAEFIDNPDALYPEPDKIIGMSDNDFKHAFGATALFWRGRKTIARNAEISKRNLQSKVGFRPQPKE